MKIASVLVVTATLAPGVAWAARVCDADLDVFVNDGGNNLFSIGEPIPIKVELKLGEAEPEETLYITQFQHLLDCEIGESYEDCQTRGGDPGNVINFVSGSETTNCVVDDPPYPPPGASTVAGQVNGQQSGIEVDFTFAEAASPFDSSAAVLDSPPLSQNGGTFNSCTVEFDVVVEELSSLSAQLDVIEWSGFIKEWAICDPGEDQLESSSSGQIGFRISNPNVVIWVTKDFTDDNKAGVDVRLQCDAGTVMNPDFSPLTDPATDGVFDKVGFVVYNIPSLGTNCRVFEEPVPGGYTASYKAGILEATEGEYADFGEDEEGCFFDALKGGEYTCDITNTGKPAEFTVFKEWVVFGDGGVEVLEEADVTITCDREMFPNEIDEDSDENEVLGVVIPPIHLNGDWRMIGTLGDGEFMTALVDTVDDAANCFATETVESSGVESVDDCTKSRNLGPGETDECTFINTVFFEGIPTLNQYGMILMMLLMLGLGAFTFRRLV